MTLYMKQKVFSWNDRFTVRDAANTDAFTVEGQIFSLGKKLHVYDARGDEVAYIEQKVFSLLPRYYIHIGGQVVEMVKDLTFLRPSFRLEGYPWKLDGNFMAHEYSLTDNGRPVMNVYKQWFTWGDSYAMEIADPQYALLCLCMVLVIDCVLFSGKDG